MPALRRLHRVTAIVPLAVLSVALTVSLTGVGGSAPVADDATTRLPDGSTVPKRAIQAPASVSSPTSAAPAAAAAARGNVDRIISTASTSGIPSTALAAYQRAAVVINTADTSCAMPWELIAAIGRVESDHGRFGGSSLSDEGVAEPGIYGVALDGTHHTRRILDTDAGQYDSDTSFDRAVGPMQFIPSTWSVVGVDGDNDGKRNPQDVDDAALGTAIYLCSGDDDLSTDQGQRAGVHRYNHSNRYVDLVVSIMRAYMAGDFTSVPADTTFIDAFLPGTVATASTPVRTGKNAGTNAGTNPDANKGRGEAVAVAVGSTSKPTPTPKPTPTSSATPSPTSQPTPTPTATAMPTKVPTKLPTVPAPPTQLPLPTTSVPPIPPTLTVAQAQAQCEASGISVLDVTGMKACIDALMTKP